MDKHGAPVIGDNVMQKRRAFRSCGIFIAGPPVLFLILFYFYPLIKILLYSWGVTGMKTAHGSAGFSNVNVYLKILGFTVFQAGLSTILTVCCALPGAFVMARYRFSGKRLVNALTLVPFVLPTVVTASAFQALLGPNGLVNQWSKGLFHLAHPPVQIDQTMWFFLLAHVFYNYTLVVRMVGGFWGGIHPRIEESARMLGAGPIDIFRKVTLPLILPAVGASALLVFIFCFTSFGVVLILGGPRYATIEVEIYRQAVQLFNLPMAATLSVIQIAFNFIFMWVYAGLARRSAVSMDPVSASRGERPAEKWWEKWLVFTNLGFMTVLLGAPISALILRSVLVDGGFSLAYYMALFEQQARSVFFVPPGWAVMNSLGFALTATGISVFLGAFAALYLALPGARAKTLFDAVFMLPLATSAVTIGFGYIISLNAPPLNLRDSAALVPLAHALVAFPFVVRCVLPTLRRIPNRLREAARMLGASPAVVRFRIDLPVAGRALILGAVFAFSISMGEFGASSFVARPHTPTMPVAIFRLLGQPGELNYGQAMAMSTLLMLVTACAFYLLDRLRFQRKGMF